MWMPPVRGYLLYALLMTALAACSRPDLAYRNLDVIVPWSLGDYLDMNHEQKDWFSDRLKEHLRWHCATQLPANLEWLGKVQQMVASDQVTDAQLQQRTAEAKLAIAELAKEITPSAVQLLQGLDDRQIRDMQQSFVDDLRKRREEFVTPPLNRQISERAKRMQKRLSPWFGTLSDSQIRRIDLWSTALGDQYKEWIDNREHWQTLFMSALQHRHDGDFAPRIAQLLQRRESLWTPQYRASFAQTEQATRELFVGLMADSTPAQREQIQEKLAGLRRDFSQLKCLQASP